MVVFPLRSHAVTVTVRVPAVEVSIIEPLATEPLQDSTPTPLPSSHVNCTVAAAPTATVVGRRG